jgi:hypothetical protein
MARAQQRRTARPRRRPQQTWSGRMRPAARKIGAFLVAAVLAAVAAWVTGLTGRAINAVAGLFGDDSPVTTTGRRLDPPPSPRSSASTVATRWKGSLEGHRDCGGRAEDGLIVARPPAAIRPPSSGGDEYEAARRWIDEYHAADRSVTGYEFVVQGKPGRTATLLGARAEYVSRQAPSAVATVVFLEYEECGGVEPPRKFTIDLDDPAGRMVPAAGEKTDFPYTVRNDDPEVFHVVATTRTCDCVWRIALTWSADGKTGTSYLVDDERGDNFHTAPDRDLPKLSWTCFSEQGCWQPKKPGG